MTDAPVELKVLQMTDTAKQSLIDLRTSLFYDDVSSLTERMFTGDISIGQFEEAMKKMIREMYASTAAVSKSGWTNMTSQDWGRLGPVLKDQYRYLHGYAEYIDENKDTVSIDYLKNRSRMYARPIGNIIAMMTAGIELSHALPWLPGDMSTECDGNCKCYWQLEIYDTVDKVNYIRATWRLTDAEHCKTCVGRDGYSITVELDSSIDVPPTIGNTQV